MENVLSREHIISSIIKEKAKLGIIHYIFALFNLPFAAVLFWRAIKNIHFILAAGSGLSVLGIFYS